MRSSEQKSELARRQSGGDRRHKAKSIAKSEERGGQESGERQSFSSVIALNHAGNS